MQLDEQFLIKTTDDLRDVIPDPHPKLVEKVKSQLLPEFIEFIGRSALVMVGTVDAQGNVDVSPKGDAPGFVQVLDEHTLLLPDRSGNKLAYGMENLVQTGQISLLFIVHGVRETLRVTGRVKISRDPNLLERCAADGKPAVLVCHIEVDQAFFHCGKALVRSKLWQVQATNTTDEALVHEHFAKDHNISADAVAQDLEAYYNSGD